MEGGVRCSQIAFLFVIWIRYVRIKIHTNMHLDTRNKGPSTNQLTPRRQQGVILSARGGQGGGVGEGKNDQKSASWFMEVP